MLINNSRLLNCPILSLHIGGQIGRVVETIVDPETLKVIACRVDGPLVGREVGDILPMDSVREFSRLGMIVDSADEFVEADEIIRVKEILGLNFSLTNLKAETRKKRKLGKVIDFTLDPNSWQIQQIIVQRPMMQSFLDPELTISRSQIYEITDYKIIIKDSTEKAKSKTKAVASPDFSPNFINPFREPDFAADDAQYVNQGK